ncbi:hypothetical protein V8C86DRAFT_2520387 [Haematococcus lacustris]
MGGLPSNLTACAVRRIILCSLLYSSCSALAPHRCRAPLCLPCCSCCCCCPILDPSVVMRGLVASLLMTRLSCWRLCCGSQDAVPASLCHEGQRASKTHSKAQLR